MKENHGQYLNDASGGLKKYLLENGPFNGRVADSDDPERRGRVRVRIPVLHGSERDMPTEILPWCTNTSNSSDVTFHTPEVGKIVWVEFPQGDLYHPVLTHAEHHDPSLQAKLDTYRGQSSAEAYRSFRAITFSADCQVWSDNQQGFTADYNMSQINIDTDRNIHLELQGPDVRLNLVHRDADQNLINGPNFFQWFDEFIQHLMGSRLGPYIGNLGAPVLANPAFLQVCNKYFALRNTKFLNWYAFVRDNRPWEPLRRISWDQQGDLTAQQRQITPQQGQANRGPGNVVLPEDVNIPGFDLEASQQENVN